jgi:hypothetical protein
MTRRETPLDAFRILEALTEHDVDYVLIGGLAVQAHGHTRTTQDVDLVPSRSSANLARLTLALEALHARPAGHSLDPSTERLALPADGVASLESDAGGVDIHLSPPCAPVYADLRERALIIEVRGLQVAVASRDDLIGMKRASGRPIDRGDVLALTQPRRG